MCGPGRRDGMHVTPGPVPDRPHLLAAPWVVRERETSSRPGPDAGCLGCPRLPELPGRRNGSRHMCLLGTMTARVDRRPSVGESLVVYSWTREQHGRRYETSAVMVDERGDVRRQGRFDVDRHSASASAETDRPVQPSRPKAVAPLLRLSACPGGPGRSLRSCKRVRSCLDVGRSRLTPVVIGGWWSSHRARLDLFGVPALRRPDRRAPTVIPLDPAGDGVFTAATPPQHRGAVRSACRGVRRCRRGHRVSVIGGSSGLTCRLGPRSRACGIDGPAHPLRRFPSRLRTRVAS